ncbi:CsxC family protein [Clostridium ganghwense]|uniref:DUF7852 domain-containing protein n=1 Tax=Clostridium ganghwense TaxID=312089 RepID=A0ABT4CSG7_9CLOT|nr:hypothetical protein [Clostridium ganghwense]MCY6371997.1 hypothetical protein [Clostridium ganghwense]
MEDRCRPTCCGKVNATTLPLCDGENLKPHGIHGPLVAKIPVVLGEKDIQIDVEAEIEFKEPYYEIKRIKKDIFLTQCKLIPRIGKKQCGRKLKSGKLFLEGFVRKNIEYATACCTSDDAVCGDIKHMTVDVPFRCVTEIEYDVPPQVCTRKPAEEIELICTKQCCNDCEDQVIGAVPCEQNFEDVICYTEKPFCELEEARIYEADIHKERVCTCPTHPYKKIVEKMVVYLRIKVLQLQQVKIKDGCGCNGGCKDKCKDGCKDMCSCID